MDPGGLADQEPFTAWLRRGLGRNRVFVAPKLYDPLGTDEAIRKQSRQRFGRARHVIERQRQCHKQPRLCFSMKANQFTITGRTT